MKIKKGKVIPPNITSPDMMEECENMIHRNINVNETETNKYNLDELIEKSPDDISPAMMQDYGNEELDDSKKTPRIRQKKGLDYEQRYKST